MEWYTAAKLTAQAIFNEEFRKKLFIIIAVIIMAISIIGFGIVSLPIYVLNLPQLVFQDKETSNKTMSEFNTILADYKDRINSKVSDIKGNMDRHKKKDKEEEEEEITVSISYPTVSLLIAYDNVINKDRLTKDKSIPINKDDIFSFLDQCMVYNSGNSSIDVSVKSIDDISNFFKSEEEKQMFKAIYSSMNNLDMGNNTPSITIGDLKYLEGGIKLPYLNQGDGAWRDKPYGSSTIGKSGCGITSLSMVVNGLLPESNILPPEMANWSASNGYYIEGAGTAWSIFEAAAQKYNLKCRNLSRDNPQEILDELTKGHPIIVSMSAGHFTRGGHLMVLRGISNSGKILVSDPASIERSNEEWDFSIILTESSVNSPSCFWSFSK